MATSAELLVDGFGRIRENVADVLDGLTAEQLAYQVDPGANPVSWLVWHLTRVQDDHVAAAFGVPQVWSSAGWATVRAAGRNDGPRVRSHPGAGRRRGGRNRAAGLLAEYHEQTYAQSVKLVSEVTDDDLDRVVDTRWTPHVTLGVRLVSVLDDDMQHVGQAAYVRGLLLLKG